MQEKLTALIVDDELPARIAISKLGNWAKYHFHKPYEAADGEEALMQMRELHPDLVCVDMSMPKMNGTVFLEQASKEFPGTKFIIISGYDQFQYAKVGIRCGAVDYLLKPIEPEALNAAIEKSVRALIPDFEPEDAGQNPESSSAEICESIHNYIEKHYSENISVASLASQYHFSKEYLSRIFKNRYQMGIYEYILQIRMKRACVLLRDPSLQIRDIAARLGYADNNYFSKAFRSFYGITPSEYRADPDRL